MEEVKLSKFDKAIGYVFRGFDLITQPVRKYSEKKVSEGVKKKSDGYEMEGHVHGIYSDGYYTPKKILQFCRERDIEIVAISEHDTLEHWNSCRKAEEKFPDVLNIPSVEITSRDGDIIAYFDSYDRKNLKSVRKLVENRNLRATEVINAVHRAGGVAIAAHPNKSRGLSSREIIALSNRLDGYEKINIESGSYESGLLEKETKIASLGSSDSHAVTIGAAVTKIRPEVYERCLIDGVLDKDLARKTVIECIRGERDRKEKGLEPNMTPLRIIESGLEQNASKLTYINPAACILKLVEYFDDKYKTIAKKLELILDGY